MIKAATFTAAAAFALSTLSFSAAAQESTDGYVVIDAVQLVPTK